MVEPLSLEEFLDRKRDYSPFLVHLTKDGVDVLGDPCVSAKDVLDKILSEKTLKAYNHFCLFSPNLNETKDDNLQNKFKVVCFTETPIDQIDVLLAEVTGRVFKPKPYGLVFQKEYVRREGGNPIFYTTKEIARPLWQSYWPLCNGSIQQSSEELCKLLALVSVCEEGNDWHWEREWRIVGDLKFSLTGIYCGLCPENDISYFERHYKPVKFISPNWGINKILDRLVGK
jgi:hypothetical protein